LLLAASANSRVIVLTMHCAEEFKDIIASREVHGYILKSDEEDVVITAIRKILSGEKFFSPAVSSLTAQDYEGQPRTKGRLTTREKQAIRLLAEGKSNKEVSAHLGLSVRTVENHRARIMHKLHLSSFSDIVRHAIRNKLVEP